MMNALLRSRRTWAFAAAIAVAPLLPGCTSAPSDLTLNHITVEPVQLTHIVHFAAGSAALAPSEAASLRTFLRYGVARANSIRLVSGSGPIADARLANVSRAIAALGMPHSVAPPNPAIAADAVDVTVNGVAAVPPSCPNWTVLGPYDPSNSSMSNLGCATNTNLYLMVADPRDLVSGHALAPAEAAPSVRAIEAYRTGDQKLNPQAPSLGDQGIMGGSGGASSSGNGQ